LNHAIRGLEEQIGVRLLAPKLGQFVRQYPDVVLDVTTEDGPLDLVAFPSGQPLQESQSTLGRTRHHAQDVNGLTILVVIPA
jgi:DNA-binding transcriptional LysR family regulator